MRIRKAFSASALIRTMKALAIMLIPIIAVTLARAQVDTDDEIFRSIQELRAGGTIPIRDSFQVPFNGVRWATDTREFIYAPMRRALERITDIDVSGAGRGEIIESLFDLWRRAGVPEEELELLRRTTPGTLLAQYGVLPQTEDPSGQRQTENFTWENFLTNVIPPSENTHGRNALAQLALHAIASDVRTAVGALAPPGGTLPEFFDERQGARAPGAISGAATTRGGLGQNVAGGAAGPEAGRVLQATTASPPPNLNLLFRPSGFTQETLKNVQESSYQTVYNLPYPHNPTALTPPDQQATSVLSGTDPQRQVASVAFGTERSDQTAGGLGQANILTGVAPPGQPFAASLIQQAVLNQALARAAATAQARLNALARASTFFGPTAGGLNNLFGADNVAGRAGDLFGGGEGDEAGGRGALPPTLRDIPTQNNPPGEACAQRVPIVSAEEAKAAAALLGLPPSADPANPWQTNYIPAQSAYSVRGTNAETFTEEVIGPEDFSPPESCLWVVSWEPPNAATRVVFIEDILSAAGRKIHLLIPSL